MISTFSSVTLRSHLLLPLFLWYVLIKFCNIITNLSHASHARLENCQIDVVTIRIRSRVNGVIVYINAGTCKKSPICLDHAKMAKITVVTTNINVVKFIPKLFTTKDV